MANILKELENEFMRAELTEAECEEYKDLSRKQSWGNVLKQAFEEGDEIPELESFTSDFETVYYNPNDPRSFKNADEAARYLEFLNREAHYAYKNLGNMLED